MELSTALIKKTLQRKGYKWYNEDANIIGIRSTLQAPDIFNDFLCVIFKQPPMPSSYSVLNKQKWLNKWGYKGSNGKLLAEDGKIGSNTNYALAQYNNYKNKERLIIYVITTDPGVYYQTVRLLNAKGCAVMKPGQYVNCYRLGTHKTADHKALVQTGGKVTVYRDNNKNGIAENLGVEETGYFGCNIHGAKKFTKTDKIGAYSAGCQVFEDWYQKEEFVRICLQFKNANNNKFTYTLIEEKDLIK
ncbi:MAG: hypothetical protein IPM51_07015 [Sphingobacteriaceae bacterium]|nr:hypothetical protein [Sphingobacteriaceae bacterium]